MTFLGFHIPFTSKSNEWISVKNKLPELGKPVIALIKYESDKYITDLSIYAVLCENNEKCEYYWQCISGITKDVLFLVESNNYWKYN